MNLNNVEKQTNKIMGVMAQDLYSSDNNERTGRFNRIVDVDIVDD